MGVEGDTIDELESLLGGEQICERLDLSDGPVWEAAILPNAEETGLRTRSAIVRPYPKAMVTLQKKYWELARIGPKSLLGSGNPSKFVQDQSHDRGKK